MKNLLHKLKVPRKLQLVSLSYSLPMAVMVYLIISGINTNIQFAQSEGQGNAYQRPLEALLEFLPQHGQLAGRVLAGEKQLADLVSNKQAQIDKAFEQLDAADAQFGRSLQFTDEGLAKRKREHFRAATLRKEWQDLKSQLAGAKPEAAVERHAHLIADVRMMITHAGDTSNLILDPDLDSYYLMDATLVALPQTQDRLAAVMTFAEPLLRQKSFSPKERVQLSVHAAMLKEADLDRVTGSTQTALNEDQNFYGVSATFQKNIPPALKEYADAAQAFIELTSRIADSEKVEVAVEDYLAAGAKAREASFKYWRTGVDELDALLQARVHSYQRSRVWALGSAGSALLATLVFVFFITRSITGPLRIVMTRLTGCAGQVKTSALPLADSSQRLAEGASEQLASLEETSASLEEISSMTKRNADSAHEAKALANQTRTAAETGAVDMQQMTSAMEAIKSSSDNIAKIIKTIDEIAFQTNILALNAAVEAARAGEAGMGFAVVADEVRNLAQRSAFAARETAEKIEDSIRKSENGVLISAKVAASLQEIVTKARHVDDLIGEIASASKEQSLGVSQVSTAATQMEKVTQGTAVDADRTSQISHELGAEAQSLAEIVAQLARLIGDGKPAPTQLTPASPDEQPAQSAYTRSSVEPAAAASTIRLNSSRYTSTNRAKQDEATALNPPFQRAIAARPMAASRSENPIPLPDDFKDF